MKKLLGLALIGSVTAFTASAQRIDDAKVPKAVKESFARQFPGVEAKWEKEKGKYEASFEQKEHEMSALFEPKGTMDESEMEIRVSELPVPVKDYVKQHEKNAAIKEAAKITKANGEINYEAEVKGRDLIFDANGKFLKSENG